MTDLIHDAFQRGARYWMKGLKPPERRNVPRDGSSADPPPWLPSAGSVPITFWGCTPAAAIQNGDMLDVHVGPGGWQDGRIEFQKDGNPFGGSASVEVAILSADTDVEVRDKLVAALNAAQYLQTSTTFNSKKAHWIAYDVVAGDWYDSHGYTPGPLVIFYNYLRGPVTLAQIRANSGNTGSVFAGGPWLRHCGSAPRWPFPCIIGGLTFGMISIGDEIPES